MTRNEIRVLSIVESKDKVSKRKAAALLGGTTDYAGYLLECLANEKYIKTISKDIYAILPEGAHALLERLYSLEGKLETDLERLSAEKAELSEEIERLSLRKENLAGAEVC